MEAHFTLIDLLLLTWREKKIVVFVGTTYEQLLQDWNAQFYSDPSESAENPESVSLMFAPAWPLSFFNIGVSWWHLGWKTGCSKLNLVIAHQSLEGFAVTKNVLSNKVLRLEMII